MWQTLKHIAAALVLAGCALCAAAQNSAFDPYTADIDDNIKYPAVPSKQHETVVRAMAKLAHTLTDEEYYDCSFVRSGEVVMVTIACSDLFAPNSTQLKEIAGELLQPLLKYIKHSERYKVILAVHSDNTGDEEYSDKLTSDRATAIDEYYYSINDNNDTGIIPYGIGADEPLKPNTGIANRAANRRVEIYFVPTAEYIEALKRK